MQNAFDIANIFRSFSSIFHNITVPNLQKRSTLALSRSDFYPNIWSLTNFSSIIASCISALFQTDSRNIPTYICGEQLTYCISISVPTGGVLWEYNRRAVHRGTPLIFRPFYSGVKQLRVLTRTQEVERSKFVKPFLHITEPEQIQYPEFNSCFFASLKIVWLQ